MGSEDALRAVLLLRPKHVVSIHYNTFGMIAQDPGAWAARVCEQTSAVPHVMQPGDSLRL